VQQHSPVPEVQLVAVQSQRSAPAQSAQRLELPTQQRLKLVPMTVTHSRSELQQVRPLHSQTVLV
jgi:hypothetical protein